MNTTEKAGDPEAATSRRFGIVWRDIISLTSHHSSLKSPSVVALTSQDPPGKTTHGTADMMAQAAGISASAVRRVLKVHGLQPHHC
ncbi:MAG: hypothetical protein EKK31_16990 [Hyphomicrobiales bacterium]|nr:MAG: hypothetical protein EKK31_16990 [Hyphomicrobiales bacterium]